MAVRYASRSWLAPAAALPYTLDMTQGQAPTESLKQDQFTIRRKVFKLFGQAFHIYDSADNLVAYSKLKAFKLKEDIRLFTDETMSTPVMIISARSIIDFSAAYDITVAATGEKVGALRRKGFKSMFRDEWEMLDTADNVIGTMKEDSAVAALVRRFADNWAFLLPQKFHAEVGGQEVAVYKQAVNPFVQKLQCDFSQAGSTDRRLLLGAGILLSAIEGRQS